MSPAVFVRHVRIQVLGIMNQYINTLAEFHPLLVAGCNVTRRVEFVVGDIGAGSAILVDTVGVASTRMINSDALDAEILPGKFRVKIFCDTFRIGG